MLTTTIGSTALAAAMATGLLFSAPAMAASDPYIGETMIVPYNFCPNGWLEANGALLSISEYDVLFALIGTTYGGDGQTTFGLPDLRGRVPIHKGQGTGLSNYVIGQMSGVESVTLTLGNLPTHNHTVQATNVAADKGGPADKILGARVGMPKPYIDGTPNRVMAADMITATGGSQPFDKMSPYLAMRPCISLFGIFPSQN